MTRPRVIYEAKPGSPLDVDRALYERLAGEAGTRSLVERFVVPRRSGRAWPVRAGQLFRIVAAEGPQVADLNVWNLGNPRERFWAARTRQHHRAHLTTVDLLWSCLPYLRPMLTITRDSIQYGRDADGGGCHDLLGTRCDPYVHKLLNHGEEFDLCCHSNLVRAVAPYHLTELDVHDVLNVFQVTGLTADGRYFVKPSPARAGDFIEFFAEIDVLCAISVCPHGDLSVPVWGSDAGDPGATCRPLMAPCAMPRYGLLGVVGHHDNCRDNLHAALAELGLSIPTTPPSLNLFMNIPWTLDGCLAWGEPVSAPGSYAVFRAEMDLVIAFSACPQDILPINGRTGRTTEAHFTTEGP